jgi:hypothetical protein
VVEVGGGWWWWEREANSLRLALMITSKVIGIIYMVFFVFLSKLFFGATVPRVTSLLFEARRRRRTKHASSVLNVT